MDEPNKPNEILLKVVGGLFAAVIAPILTGIVLYYIQKKLDDPKPDASAQVAKAAPGPDVPNAPTSTPTAATPRAPRLARADADATLKTKSQPTDPPKPASAPGLAAADTPSGHRPFPKKKALPAQRLFNGQDLTGFDTYLGTPRGGTSPYGRNNDPERVFTVAGGQLHISGKVFGGLVTQNSYENYRLTLEYKWGEKKWHPRANLLRSSGIVLHASGTPGDIQGWSMTGITCHIGESDTGALAVPTGLTKPISLSAQAEKVALKKAERVFYAYKPGEPVTTVQSGMIHRLDYRPPLAKAAPAKSSHVQVNPVGEWNKLECICVGDRITIVLNGTVVNVANRVSQTRGKIFIESHGAEISFRNIEIRPQLR